MFSPRKASGIPMAILTRWNSDPTGKRNAGRLFVPYQAMNGCIDASTLTFGNACVTSRAVDRPITALTTNEA